jgi:hypothetical protein
MNWTNRTFIIAALAAITLTCPTIGRAEEPGDAATSAAQSAVRDARDQMMTKEKGSESRHVPPRCEDGKADCHVKSENAEHEREHAKPQ